MNNKTIKMACGYCLAVALIVSCSQQPELESGADDADAQVIVQDLKVLIVGDPALGASLTREWSARREGQLECVSISEDEFSEQGFQLDREIDVVVYPPRLLGELVAAEQIDPITDTVWGDEENLNKKEILRHPRTTNVRMSNKVWGVPLGAPHFVMMYRRDVLKALDEDVPETWSEFDALCRVLRSSDELEAGESVLPRSAVLPLAESWRAQMLLLRVAPYVRTRGRLSVFFERDTVEPLINGAPFVRALQELQEIAGESTGDFAVTPEAAFKKMMVGEAAIAITWPSVAFAQELEQSEWAEEIGIAAIPGSPDLFDSADAQWTLRNPNAQQRVPLVGFSGLIASVNKKSGQLFTAQELVKWMPSKRISSVLLPKSKYSGPFRATHLGNPQVWSGELISPEAGDEYGEILRQINDETVVVVFPRIPKQARYLAALDDAVRQAVSGEVSAQEALDWAASQFQAITEEVGARAQNRWLKSSRDF